MLNRFVGVDDLWATEMFAGGGGSGTGMLAAGVKPRFAANHAEPCKWTYVANHPEVDFWLGDVQQADAIEKFPYAPFFWASPACPRFSGARGDKRWFDKENQLALWADDLDDLTEDQKAGIRSRALMEEVVTYLRHCQTKYGRPVLGFGVENVKEARLWAYWDRWCREMRKLGYHIRVIAINAMHVQGRTLGMTPQSRNRLLVAGVHESVGRLPNYRKWFDPWAYCPRHGGWIQAQQAWKVPGQDMGVYGPKNGQYYYVCPELRCKGQMVEPPVLPAAACIDWTDLGTPIGSRKKTKDKPEGLAPATIARVRAGVEEHWIKPFLAPAGGTWNNDTSGADELVRTLTTREANALVVPCEGRDGKQAKTTGEPIRTQTTRLESALAFQPDSFLTLLRSGRARNTNPHTDPTATLVADGSNHAFVTRSDGQQPLMFPMRGGGDALKSRPVFDDPAHAVTAGGFHHGLGIPPDFEVPAGFVMRNNGSKGDGREHCTTFDEPVRTITQTGHQSLVTLTGLLEPLLMSYYGNGRVNAVSEPVGTLPTRDRWALLTPDGQIDVASILFRMLKLDELRRAQSFPEGYQFVAKSQRDKVRLIGNAVPPPMAEVLTCAVVEAIIGEEMERFAAPLAA